MSHWGGRAASSSGWEGAPSGPKTWDTPSSGGGWKKPTQWAEGAKWDPTQGFWKDLSHRDHRYEVNWGKMPSDLRMSQEILWKKFLKTL